MMSRTDKPPFLLILDRDGTLIKDTGYLSDPDQIEFETGAIEGIRAMVATGAVPVIVTNQSGVGRGYFSQSDVDAVHERLSQLLSDKGVEIAGYYSCPHHPDEHCPCRKPGTLLGLQAATTRRLPLDTAIVVGDKISDMDFASRLGAQGVLVRTGAEPHRVHRARQVRGW